MCEHICFVLKLGIKKENYFVCQNYYFLVLQRMNCESCVCAARSEVSEQEVLPLQQLDSSESEVLKLGRAQVEADGHDDSFRRQQTEAQNRLEPQTHQVAPIHQQVVF